MTILGEDDLELLRDTARRYFEDTMPVDAFRRLRDAGDATGFDRERWREMADMGWAGILVPEAHGGTASGLAALGTVLEQGGRTLAASPLIATALIGASTLAHADEPLREALLAPLANGECLLAPALEEGPRHAPYAVATRAEWGGDGFVVNGRKTFVMDGHVADQLVVVARTSGGSEERDGLTVLLVDASAPGVHVERTAMVDARNAANVELVDVVVGREALVGAAGEGAGILDAVLDAARAGVAAEMLGIGQEAFDRTVEYLKVREQFDVPIGSFQALKHRAAQMYCELELARSAVYAALAALDEGAGDAAELASVAKAAACDMVELVTNEAVQMHGGIGMTDAADIGLFLKRARVLQQYFGDAAFHRARYAALLGL